MEIKRKVRFAASVVVTLGMVGLGFSGASCTQPPIQCVVGHGPFIAKYTLIEGTGSCAGLKGGEIGLSTYLKRGDGPNIANYDERRVSVQPRLLGAMAQTAEELGASDPALKPYAIGDYTSDPDDKSLCYAGGLAGTPALSVAEQKTPEIPAMMNEDGTMTDPVPAAHIRETWSNLKVYVTAEVPGTQMIAEMRYEDLIEQCEARYKVVALFPAVSCEGETGEPDDKLCDPKPNFDEGRAFGSGINPDFKTRCDPEIKYCVLDETPLPER